MPRRRYLSPDFWDSPTALQVGVGARLMLLGCWTFADDEGLLRWEAPLLKDLIFSSDDDVAEEDVHAWMKQLVATGSVLAYRAGKHHTRLAYLVGFERDHRTGRPKPSTLLPPNPAHADTAAAYARRDGHACALCGGTVATATQALLGAFEGLPGEPAPSDLSGVLTLVDAATKPVPSNVVTAHALCVSLRGNLPLGEATTDPQIQAVADLAAAAYGDEPVSARPASHRTFTKRTKAAAASNETSETAVSGNQDGTGTAPDNAAEGASIDPDLGLEATSNRPTPGNAGLSESSNAGLTEFVVSEALPDSRTFSEDAVNGENPPLTCGNSDSLRMHGGCSEDAVSAHDTLTTNSPTEVEVEVEMEVEVETLSASRSCAAGGVAGGATIDESINPHDLAHPTPSAFGAGQQQDKPHPPTAVTPTPVVAPSHTQTVSTTDSQPPHPAAATGTTNKTDETTSVAPDLSAADVVLDKPRSHAQPTPQTGDDDMPDEQISMFDVSADMVQAPVATAVHFAPDTWSPERIAAAEAAADDMLKTWWATYGDTSRQASTTVHRRILDALGKGASAKKVAERLHALGADGTDVTVGLLAPKRTSKAPEERRAQATELAREFWSAHGTGWPQTYGVVFSVLVAVLGQGVPVSDIRTALTVLGQQRKPVSGGTIGFALSKSATQVSEERAREALASSRSASKYTRRTM